jgi:hypothetical protein
LAYSNNRAAAEIAPSTCGGTKVSAANRECRNFFAVAEVPAG